jgi:hypothetical protein
MNRTLFVSAIAALALLFGAGLSGAQQSGTAAEAKAMLERAVAALKANEATALSEFNDKNNKQFRDRDLYVFCVNMSDGKITASAKTGLGWYGHPGSTTRFRARPQEASSQWTTISRSPARLSTFQSNPS